MGQIYTLPVAVQYDRFQDSFGVLGLRRQYLNYGFSEHRGQELEESQERLVRKVFELANIQGDETVLDVGFGSGEQDFLLARLTPFRRLVGVNIAAAQVNAARRRAAQEGLQSRMTFLCSRAEDMAGIASGTIDKMLAIECAFYFDRPRFYREAARVLLPGGRLVLADIMLGPALQWLAEIPNHFRTAGTLPVNRRAWERYFRTVSIRDITHHTRPGAQKSVYRILGALKALNREARQAWLPMALSSQLVALGMGLKWVCYYLIVLEKQRGVKIPISGEVRA